MTKTLNIKVIWTVPPLSFEYSLYATLKDCLEAYPPQYVLSILVCNLASADLQIQEQLDIK